MIFDLEALQGSSDQGIALQTRTGRNIRNSRGLELSDRHLRLFEILQKKHENWELRKAPSGEYNCAGHVWASRRVCVYEEEDWQMILCEDGFRKTENPMPDDLAIYSDPQVGILHIGRVVELKTGVTKGSPPIPWIVSKWSDSSGESCHFVSDCPYNWGGFVVSIQFWTDRPQGTSQ